MKYLQKRLLKSLEAYLDTGEEILSDAWGTTSPKGGFGMAYLALTQKRVLVYHRGLLGYAFSYIPLKQIPMVDEATASFTDYCLRVHSNSASIVFYPTGGKKQREQAKKLASDIRHRADIDTAPATPGGDTETLRALRDLKKMCEEGLISDDEYAQKKHDLLERM